MLLFVYTTTHKRFVIFTYPQPRPLPPPPPPRQKKKKFFTTTPSEKKTIEGPLRGSPLICLGASEFHFNPLGPKSNQH